MYQQIVTIAPEREGISSRIAIGGFAAGLLAEHASLRAGVAGIHDGIPLGRPLVVSRHPERTELLNGGRCVASVTPGQLVEGDDAYAPSSAALCTARWEPEHAEADPIGSVPVRVLMAALGGHPPFPEAVLSTIGFSILRLPRVGESLFVASRGVTASEVEGYGTSWIWTSRGEMLASATTRWVGKLAESTERAA